METQLDEIADGIFRLSTFVPDIGPTGFTFNQFLVQGEEPLLFHTGPRAMFPNVSEAISRVFPVASLRWITFGHVEADKCGAMNLFLGVAPAAQVAHGALGCMVSLNDLADRPPIPMADGDVLDLGGKRVRHIDTPHVPHGWEARVFFEETTSTLLCGDLFTHLGNGPAVTEGDIWRARGSCRGCLSRQLAPSFDRRNRAQPLRAASEHPRLDARIIVQWRLCRRSATLGGRLRDRGSRPLRRPEKSSCDSAHRKGGACRSGHSGRTPTIGWRRSLEPWSAFRCRRVESMTPTSPTKTTAAMTYASSRTNHNGPDPQTTWVAPRQRSM